MLASQPCTSADLNASNLSNPMALFSVQLNTVWVSCEGENSADKENVGPIRMYPTQGIPGYYFPYENQDGYLSPVVAIWMERPTREYLVGHLTCSACAAPPWR